MQSPEHLLYISAKHSISRAHIFCTYLLYISAKHSISRAHKRARSRKRTHTLQFAVSIRSAGHVLLTVAADHVLKHGASLVAARVCVVILGDKVPSRVHSEGDERGMRC